MRNNGVQDNQLHEDAAELEAVAGPARFNIDDEVQYRWFYNEGPFADPFPELRDEWLIVIGRFVKIELGKVEWWYDCQHKPNAYVPHKKVYEIPESYLWLND